MSQENVEIVKRMVDAFNAKDLDRFSDQTTPDFEWSSSMMAIEGEVFVGRAGIEAYFSRMIDGWDTFRAEDGEFRDLGDRVLWSGRLEGRGRISGAPVSAPLDILYELRDGKVTRSRSFLDHEQALKAAGLAE
jgi:ketosteroid isomerase-like protein